MNCRIDKPPIDWRNRIQSNIYLKNTEVHKEICLYGTYPLAIVQINFPIANRLFKRYCRMELQPISGMIAMGYHLIGIQDRATKQRGAQRKGIK